MKALILGIFLLMMGVNAAVASSEPFAVVELFASEGCSSCPPADDLLIRLTQQAQAQGKRIFTLSFQVDYWNYLGWRDPFSSPQFAQRQRQYADVLQSSSVYTPQMIINGQKAFIGSDAGLAQKYIEQYLQAPALNSIELTIKSQDSHQVQLGYSCAQLTKDTVLHVALVQGPLESHPLAGENEGRLLHHDHIVRVFKTIPFNQLGGVVDIDIPDFKEAKHLTAIAFLQNTHTMNILAASSINLS